MLKDVAVVQLLCLGSSDKNWGWRKKMVTKDAIIDRRHHQNPAIRISPDSMAISRLRLEQSVSVAERSDTLSALNGSASRTLRG